MDEFNAVRKPFQHLHKQVIILKRIMAGLFLLRWVAYWNILAVWMEKQLPGFMSKRVCVLVSVGQSARSSLCPISMLFAPMTFVTTARARCICIGESREILYTYYPGQDVLFRPFRWQRTSGCSLLGNKWVCTWGTRVDTRTPGI